MKPTWSQRDDQLMNFVSDKRRKKVSEYRLIIDRKSCLYSALVIRKKIEEIIGIPMAQQKYIYIENHKPRIDTNIRIDFNISHSEDYLCCGISLDTYIGIDIEKISVASLAIENCIFHKNEIAYIKKGSDPNLNFYKMWTRKEAYGKYLGLGLATNLTSVDTLSPNKHYWLSTFLKEDSLISVCSEQFENIRIEEIDENNLF